MHRLVSAPVMVYIDVGQTQITMELDPATTELLKELEHLATKPLLRRDDIGALIEVASRSGAVQTLEELSFFAKFCHKTYGIMHRIGPGADGYDRMAGEFTSGVQKCKELLASIVHHAPEEIQRRFEREFLAVTPVAMSNLLDLFNGLSWYKNRQLDDRSKRR